MNQSIQLLHTQLKKTKKILPFIFLLWAPCIANAQEVYDLRRCIITGLERNLSVKVAHNNQQIAENNNTKGNAGLLPKVTTTNRFGGSVNSTTQNLNDGSRNLTNGVLNTSGSAGVNASIPLFHGFGNTNNLEKLNELKGIGELRTQMSMENLVAQIIAEYNYFIQQMDYVNNIEYALSLSRERVRIDEERNLLGSSSKLELLQSIVYLNADSSQLARQNEQILESEVRIKKLMALENIEEKITLSDTIILFSTGLDYDALLESTLNNNTSLLIARKNQNISKLDYNIIASRAYPYLDLSSGYNYSYRLYGTGTISDYGALQINNQNSRSLNYGLTLGMDIFDGFNHRRDKANARITIENRTFQYQEIEQDIKAELLTIYYAYENNLRLVKMEERNLEVARENLDIALERYRLGSLSGLELREVQKSLLDAEERLIYVKYQTKLAEISLLQISGQIMDHLI